MAGDEVLSKGPLTQVADGQVEFARHLPVGAATALVRHYWITRWRLPVGASREVPILVYPACNVVVEEGLARLYPPVADLSVKVLEGEGWGFGVLLLPSAGRRLAGRPIDRLAQRPLDLDTALARAVDAAMTDGADRHAAAIAAFESWAESVLPPRTADDDLIDAICAAVETDRGITRVSDLAHRLAVSDRRLERLVQRYIGFGPKWLIQRRRLQDAAHVLRTQVRPDLAGLAHELGYADYSHFSRDFAATVGMTPHDFAAQRRRPVTPGREG